LSGEHHPAPVLFEGARHRCGRTLGSTLRHESIEELHNLARQADGDLRG
jgi:hypothetical protein